MSSNSMIGSRVSALFGDGYYAPATIQKHEGDGIYLVKFDDNEVIKCSGENMVGERFKNVSDIKLQRFQKVYTTHKGHEICGYVQECNDNVIVISIVDPSTRQKEIISRKIENISLLDKRMDNGNSCKTRPVSASIEVPKPSRICRTSEEPTMTELMAAMVLSNLSCSPVFHNPATHNKGSAPHSFDSSGVGSWNPEVHHMSPPRHTVIQHAPPRETDSTHLQTPPRRIQSPEYRSELDSDMILMDRQASPLVYTDNNQMNVDEKPQDLRIPKQTLKETSPKHIPTEVTQPPFILPAPHQLDVVMEQEEVKKVPLHPIPFPSNIRLPYFIPAHYVQQPIYGSSLPADFRIQLASTPPHHTPDVEPVASSLGHIDNKMHRHLHRTIPYHKSSEDSTSDLTGSPSSNKPGLNYFPFSRNPIPVGSLSFSPSHHTKPTRSPLIPHPPQPQPSTSATTPIPILQSNPISVPTTYPLLGDGNYPLGVSPGQPINIPGAKAFSWNNSGMTLYHTQKPSIVQQRQQLHHGVSPKMTFQVSPKSLPLGRKVRGDGKKCRKVYGMENRDMWCTACRWKKACQRFPD